MKIFSYELASTTMFLIGKTVLSCVGFEKSWCSLDILNRLIFREQSILL